MSNVVDARGLACPQPVILTKRHMDNREEELTTIVDNEAARENVSKLAKSQGYSLAVEEKEGVFYLTMTRSAEPELEMGGSVKNTAILIKSNVFGTGSEELGQTLMKSFLFTLVESNLRISHMIFMNAGVFLTTEGSPVIEHLKAMTDKGVQVLSCGTCLDYYGLKEKLSVGSVTNMYTAMEVLTTTEKSLVI